MSTEPALDVEAQKNTGISGYPCVITLEDAHHTTGDDSQLSTGATIRRTLSRPDTGIETVAHLSTEYRTLSIHVENRNRTDKDKGSATHRAAVRELADLDWHKLSVDDALQRLTVSPKTGLDSAQAQRRLRNSGRNVITPPKSNWLRKIAEWIFGGFGSLMVVASIMCFLAWKPLGNPDPQASNLALAVVLLIVLLIQAVCNAWQDFFTSRVMSSIKAMLPSDVLVLRDRIQMKVAAADLVTGDLVYVSLGEKIPADLRLIEVSGDLRLDRSILTGESEPIAGRVDKTDENFLETKNIALQGTHCVSGSGIGLVIQVGDNTIFGRVAKLSSLEPERLTTLQREILHVVFIIATGATVVAVIVVILWAAWLRRDYPNYINVSGLLIDLVSVMIAFMPTGLPLAVTLSLARIANALGKNKVLCKSLLIVETLGSVTVLCSDKTGTLTENQMHVVNAAILDKCVDIAITDTASEQSSKPVAADLVQLSAVGAICNAAKFSSSGTEEVERPIVGDATDTAILRFSDSVTPVDDVRGQWTDIHQINFNSKTKYMLKLSKLSTTSSPNAAPIAPWDHFEPDDYMMTVKGAPEILMPRCSFVLDPESGEALKLTPDFTQRLTAIQEQWARNGLRVLLLARRVIRRKMIRAEVDPSSDEYGDLIEELNTTLIIVGLVGLIDPLKSGIVHTVSTCRRAGIRFFVVTGDHPVTAAAIAEQAGILTNASTAHHASDLYEQTISEDVEKCQTETVDSLRKSIVITGAELDRLNEAQVELLCQYEEIVFARTTPEQKLRIVHEFKKRDNVVAMTGDGVNDAPSLKAADIGIAMGAGSDVAKEAADMVLLDDFSAIVVALQYGRLVFDNLKKTVLYLLPSGSFAELVPIILNILIGIPQMMSNIQMILLAVATDVLPALSLCMESPESELLERKPRNVKTDRLANWRLMLQAYGFLGMLESLCAMSMSCWYLQTRGIPFSSLALGFGNWGNFTNEDLYRAQSVYFFTVVLMQWGNLFATRGRRLSIFQHTPAQNWYIFPAAAMSLCIAIFCSYVPGVSTVFQTRGIPVEFFFIPITFGLGLLLLDELRKYFVRQYPKGLAARCAW